MRRSALQAYAVPLLCGIAGLFVSPQGGVDLVLFPRYHLTLDGTLFLNQNTPFQKTRYLIESRSDLVMGMLAFGEHLVWYNRVDVTYGMGRTPGNVVFDPMDLVFNLSPFLELRLLPVVLRTGIDHVCYHEIDRKDFATVYWNRPFVAVETPNARSTEYLRGVTGSGFSGGAGRLAASFSGGYFLKRFFGLVEPRKLNDNNNRILQGEGWVRYAVLVNREVVLVGYLETLAGLWRPPGEKRTLYWAQQTGIELYLLRSRQGALFYGTLTLDAMPPYYGQPRFSKHKMLRMGIRLFQ